MRICIHQKITRHIKDPVVWVIVWWITDAQRYCMHIYQYEYVVYFYIKKLTASRARQDMLGQPWRLELFQTGRTNTEVPNETSLASQQTSSTDTTSFSCSYSFAATIFCFFNTLKLKSSKSASYCPLYDHSSTQWKMVAFPKTIATNSCAMSSWPVIKVTQIMPGYSANKKQTKRVCTGCRKMHPLLIFCGWIDELAFHLWRWQI